MSHNLVSIIIPAYNAEETLLSTVRSAIDQTYSFIEIIVVDDGSTDNTIALFPELKKQGVLCFSIVNGGASRARNFGLSKAQGTYIQFLDADDILASEKIELQIEILESNQADISFCDWAYFNENIDEEKPIFKNINYDGLHSGKDVLEHLGIHNWFVPVFCWLTKKSIIINAGIWNEDLTNNDDGEFFTRVLYHSNKVTHTRKILGYYRRTSGESLSKLNSIDKINSAFKSYQIIQEFLIKNKTQQLLVYPKRLFYVQYLLIQKQFPKFAKRAAQHFDTIKVKIPLRPGLLEKLTTILGLHHGYQFYKLILPLIRFIKKLRL